MDTVVCVALLGLYCMTPSMMVNNGSSSLWEIVILMDIRILTCICSVCCESTLVWLCIIEH